MACIGFLIGLHNYKVFLFDYFFMLGSAGQLMSTTAHIFSALLHISISGLLWANFVDVLIRAFHQYS